MSLASSIMLATLAFIIAATVAAACLTHLTIATSQRNAQIAESLAQRAAHLAYARCGADPAYTSAINLTLNESPEGYGLVCFASNGWGVPESQNRLNLSGNGSTPGGHVVSGGTLRILAEGRYCDKVKRVELVATRAFPFALTCGNLTATNLKAFGVTTPLALVGGIPAIGENQKYSARIHAAGSLNLTSGNLMADLSAVGDIDPGAAELQGAIYPKSDPVTGPQVAAGILDTGINLPSLLTPLVNVVGNSPSTLVPGAMNLTNSTVSLLNPLTTLVTGPLNLTNSTLVSSGNVVIAGAISTAGNASIISANGDVTLLAVGTPVNPLLPKLGIRCRNLTVRGLALLPGPAWGPMLRGVAHCGNFTASNVTWVGGVHCLNQADLSNVNLLHNAESADVSLPLIMDLDPLRNLPSSQAALRILRVRTLEDGANP